MIRQKFKLFRVGDTENKYRPSKEVSGIGFGFSDEVVEMETFSIERGEFDSALQEPELALEQRPAKAIPAVSDSIVLCGPEENVVVDGKRLR